MAFTQVDASWSYSAGGYIRKFVLDSAADAANLPECCPGSTAIVAAKDGAIFMVNASGKWVEL